MRLVIDFAARINRFTDDHGNKCSVEYFGTREAAQKALDSLENCDNCINCSDCSRCSHVALLYFKQNMHGDPEAAAKIDPLGPPIVPVIENIRQTVYAAASRPDALKMTTWHTCANTHCWAGWVVTLAGEVGKRLEQFFDTPLAAMKILDASSPVRVSPVRFLESNDEALHHMKALADQEAAQVADA